MSSTPTPGPWYAVQNASYWQINAMREDGWMNKIGDMCASSCAAPEPGYSMELGEANAKLAAAAPDLLAACKAALQELATIDHACSLGMMETNPAVKQLRAALAKAEGGAQ